MAHDKAPVRQPARGHRAFARLGCRGIALADHGIGFGSQVDAIAQLQLGDRVYLTSESNAVIGKCDATTPEPGECAVASRWLADRRLVVRHHDQEIVVRAAAGLSPANVSPGDRVRLDRNGWLAKEC